MVAVVLHELPRAGRVERETPRPRVRLCLRPQSGRAEAFVAFPPGRVSICAGLFCAAVEQQIARRRAGRGLCATNAGIDPPVEVDGEEEGKALHLQRYKLNKPGQNIAKCKKAKKENTCNT